MMGYFCGKYAAFELKRYKRAVLWKKTYGFKNDKSNLVNLHKVVESNVRFKPTVYNILAKGMCFFGKKPSNFNFLDFLLLV